MNYQLTKLRVAIAIFTALSATTLINPARATVTWSFFETGISCFSGDCLLPPQPFVFATLTLPGPISHGTALWQGSGSPPVYTGDDFILSIDNIFRLSPAFTGNQGGQSCGVGGGRLTICDFDISWSTTGSSLGIMINFDAINDNIGGFAGRAFGSFGGSVATDSPNLGGCNIFSVGCVITGFWQSDLAVPEPSSAILVLAGLLGAWLSRRHRGAKVVASLLNDECGNSRRRDLGASPFPC